jgi:DNA-binding transcriptional LysR family regulator
MAGSAHDLNLLVPLRALLEEANVTRAGQRVRMGQSSMSTALARLRTAFNDELLVRVGRDYELTPLARQLLPQVQETLPLVERVLAGDGEFDPVTARRTISLMMSDYSAMRLRGPIADVLAQAPEMSVEIVGLPERPMESERDLITHDFVVMVPGVGIEGESADLLVDEYACLVDPENPALVDGALTFEAFVALPQALASFGRLHFTPADRRLRELGVDRSEPRVTAGSFLPLPSIVAGTDLVAVVPRRLAERRGPVDGVLVVDAPFGHVPIDLKLWWHESHDSDPAHVWFREELIAALREPDREAGRDEQTPAIR